MFNRAISENLEKLEKLTKAADPAINVRPHLREQLLKSRGECKMEIETQKSPGQVGLIFSVHKSITDVTKQSNLIPVNSRFFFCR